MNIFVTDKSGNTLLKEEEANKTDTCCRPNMRQPFDPHERRTQLHADPV